MASKYGIVQYYADHDTLIDAIADMAPAWENRRVRIHWRGLVIVIENTRGHCPRCKTPMWNEPKDNAICRRCNDNRLN